MNRRRLFTSGIAYLLLLVAGVVALRTLSLPWSGEPSLIVWSEWDHGALVRREALLPNESSALPIRESVIAEGPILTWPRWLFSMSLVPSRDGVKVSLAGESAYVTPDDLLALQAYDHSVEFEKLGAGFGANADAIFALAAERLHTSVAEVARYARFRRVRFSARAPHRPDVPASLRSREGRELTRQAARDAARWLARGVRDDGRFRYLVDGPTNRTLAGYEITRHAGATYFLAKASAEFADAELAHAALRAASWLRDERTQVCRSARCVAEGPVASLGASALTLLAYTEVVRTGLDPSYRVHLAPLAQFLEEQQRPNGSFFHQYDRASATPIDVELPYYAGEAALALSRFHRVSPEPHALDSASRALTHLVGSAWRFFGSDYFRAEEHWTCQAMADLWDRAPSPSALHFCETWHAWNLPMQMEHDELPYDAAGAFGVSRVVTPRLTPAAARAESLVAVVEAARRAGRPPSVLEPLEWQLERALGARLRSQFSPGPTHLFSEPSAVYGAIPGSVVDWQLRIDYAQHAGCALLGWAHLR